VVLAPLLSKLLFGVHPIDPTTLAAALLILCDSGLLACYLPARRATKIDPLVALSYE
jgi:putative ABC transport system permease protein